MTKKIKILMLSTSTLMTIPAVLVACGQAEKPNNPPGGEPGGQKPFEDSNIYTNSNQESIKKEIKEQAVLLNSSFKEIGEFIKKLAEFEEKPSNKTAMLKLSEDYLKINVNFEKDSILNNKINQINNAQDNYLENLAQIEIELIKIKQSIFLALKAFFEKTQNKALNDDEVLEDLKDFHLLGVILNSTSGNTGAKWLPIDLVNLTNNSNKELAQSVQQKLLENALKIIPSLPKNEIINVISVPNILLFNSIVSIQQNIAIAKMMHQKVTNDKVLIAIDKISKLYPERKISFDFPNKFIDEINKLDEKNKQLKNIVDKLVTDMNNPEMNISQNIKNIFTKIQTNITKISTAFNGTVGSSVSIGIKEMAARVKNLSDEMPKNKITTLTEFNLIYQKIKVLGNELSQLLFNYYNMIFEIQSLALTLEGIVKVLDELKSEKYQEIVLQISELLINLGNFTTNLLLISNPEDENNITKFSQNVTFAKSLLKIMLIQTAIDNIQDIDIKQVDWK